MKKLMEKRAELFAELEKLTNVVDSGEEIRSYTDEEVTRMDELRAEIETLDKTISEKEKSMNALAAKPVVEERAADNENNRINRFARNPLTEIRSGETMIANSSAVKYSQFSEDVIGRVLELARVADEVTTVYAKGTYKQIVSNPSYVVNGAWKAEGVAPTMSEARWTTISIEPYKFVSEVCLTYEMLNQAGFDVVPEMYNQFSLDFAYALEHGIIAGAGDGSGEPTGLLTGGTTFNVTSKVKLNADDLINAFHSLKSYYYSNAKWIMNNKTLCDVRKLKDSTGNYLFHQTELTGGYAGTILGKPVLVSEVMPDVAEGAKPILFGDFARGYKAIRNPDVMLQALNEKYAGIGQGILGVLWCGGKPVNNDAYAVVKMAE